MSPKRIAEAHRRIAAGARVALASRVTDAQCDRWSDGMDSLRSEFGIIVPAGLMWCGSQHKPEGVLT
jgi:hypothetical protein